MSDYQDVAEFLHSLGWQATGDAQWYNLRNALPQLREMLDDSLRQVLEGSEGCTLDKIAFARWVAKQPNPSLEAAFCAGRADGYTLGRMVSEMLDPSEHPEDVRALPKQWDDFAKSCIESAVAHAIQTCAIELKLRLANHAQPTSGMVTDNYCDKCGYFYKTACSCKATPAQAGAELPEPAGVLVINGQALRGFTADQMREMYRRGLKDAGA